MNKRILLLLMGLISLTLFHQSRAQSGNCDNAGFETGTADGYQTYVGRLDGRGNLVINTPGPDEERHRIMNISYGFDPIAERHCDINEFLAVVPQGAGQYAMRLGTAGTGAQAERVVLKFTVTPERAFFLLSYAVLLQDPGHEPFEQPRFELRIQDENGNTFPCGEYLVRAQESIEGFENCGSWRVRPWTTAGFELQSYLGQEVQIEILTTDCSKGGHAGYAYFDASCRPLELDLQGYCPGATSAQLIATEGFDRYQWSTGATDNAIAINNPLAGTAYSVTVTSATGCTLVLSDTLPTITELSPPSFKAIADTTLCPGNSLWIRPAGTNLGDIFSPSLGFSADSFQVRPQETTTYVFSTQDDYGCLSDTLRYTVSVDSQSVRINIAQVDIDSTSCADAADGRISVDSNADQLQWSNGASTATITELAPDNYSVRLYDEDGCFVYKSYQVPAPSPLSLQSVQIQDVPCYGENSGAITAIPTGGTAPYALPGVSDPITVVRREGLASGTYTLAIEDRNGCQYSNSYTIEEPAALQVNLVADSVRCYSESNGKIQAQVNGGTTPYQYSWGPLTQQNMDEVSGLRAGTYPMQVQDANGCITSGSVLVGEPTLLVITEIQVDSASCHDSGDGRARTLVQGGNGGYEYSWNDPTGQMGAEATGLFRGEYEVTVRDRKGCAATRSLVVPAPAPIVLQAIADSVSCYNGYDGKINLQVAGGNAGYRYVWADTTIQIANRYQLTAGSYQVNVVDRKNCQAATTVEVEQPDSISIEVIARTFPDCEKALPGSVTVAAVGGNGGYRYEWETGQQGPIITSYQAASFQVEVTDRKGCMKTASAKVPGLEVGILAEADFIDEAYTLCAGENLSLSINANNYIAESYWESEEKLPCDTCFFFNFVPLRSATYQVVAVDVKGCRDTATIFIPVEQYRAKLFVDGDFINAYQLVCFGDEVQFSIVADPAAEVIQWQSSQEISCDDCPSMSSRPNDFSRYQVEIVHKNGCRSTLSTVVDVHRNYCEAFIPNAFSPNGDGHNDRFTVPGSRSGERIRTFQVFDRWGRQVYQGKDIRIGAEEGWDGRINDRPAPVGVYVYVIDMEHFDGTKSLYRGNVHLIR